MPSHERTPPPYLAAIVVYLIAFLLPATFSWRTGVKLWGWQAAMFSLAPFAMAVRGASLGVLQAAIAVLPSNAGFILAAFALPYGAPRFAVWCASASVLSMIYCGVVVMTTGRSEFVDLSGPLGPGYVAWLVAGVLMFRSAWRAYAVDVVSEPSEDAVDPAAGRITDEATRINQQIAGAPRGRQE